MDDPDNDAEMFFAALAEKVFKDGQGRSSNAKVDGHSPSRMRHMMEGYKEAAELLIEAALAGGARHHLVLTNPLIFWATHFCREASRNGSLANRFRGWRDHANGGATA